MSEATGSGKIMATITKYAAVISSLCALGSLVCVLLVTQAILPKERPILSLSSNQIRGSVNNDIMTIDSPLVFRNAGLHSAKNVEIVIAGGIVGDEKSFKLLTKQTLANEIDASSVFSWNQQMITLPAKTVEKKISISEVYTLFLIRVNYSDSVSNKKYTSDSWITYTTGRAGVGYATMEEKRANEKFILKAVKR